MESNVPDLRHQISFVVPVPGHFTMTTDTQGRPCLRVPAIQESTGAFVIIMAPASVGTVANLFSQLPGYRLYDLDYDEPDWVNQMLLGIQAEFPALMLYRTDSG